jgi:hypothetical protein
MIIANRLTDGLVVFLTEGHDWTTDIAAGAVAENAADAEALLAGAKRAEETNLVVDPYLIPIEFSDGERRPTEYREFIRASGPSVPIPSRPGET